MSRAARSAIPAPKVAPTQTTANATPASAAAASFAARTTRRRGSTSSVGRIVPYRNSLVTASRPASVAKNTPTVTPELNRSRCASSGASSATIARERLDRDAEQAHGAGGEQQQRQRPRGAQLEQLGGELIAHARRLRGELEEHVLERRRLAGGELAQRRLDDQPAAVDDHDPIDGLGDLRQMVAGDEHRLPSAANARRKSRSQRTPSGSSPLAGLVEDQQLGIAEQGGREAEALAHPERVARRAAIRHLASSTSASTSSTRPAGTRAARASTRR